MQSKLQMSDLERFVTSVKLFGTRLVPHSSDSHTELVKACESMAGKHAGELDQLEWKPASEDVAAGPSLWRFRVYFAAPALSSRGKDVLPVGVLGPLP